MQGQPTPPGGDSIRPLRPKGWVRAGYGLAPDPRGNVPCPMAAIRLLELLILLAALAGFAGLLLRRNLFLKVLAMDVMGSAVVALFVLLAGRSGLRSPILERMANPAALGPASQGLADPIPQAVILTAIVIGLSIQALLLVVITQLARIDPSLDATSFEPADRP